MGGGAGAAAPAGSGAYLRHALTQHRLTSLPEGKQQQFKKLARRWALRETRLTSGVGRGAEGWTRRGCCSTSHSCSNCSFKRTIYFFICGCAGSLLLRVGCLELRCSASLVVECRLSASGAWASLLFPDQISSWTTPPAPPSKPQLLIDPGAQSPLCTGHCARCSPLPHVILTVLGHCMFPFLRCRN